MAIYDYSANVYGDGVGSLNGDRHHLAYSDREHAMLVRTLDFGVIAAERTRRGETALAAADVITLFEIKSTLAVLNGGIHVVSRDLSTGGTAPTMNLGVDYEDSQTDDPDEWATGVTLRTNRAGEMVRPTENIGLFKGDKLQIALVGAAPDVNCVVRVFFHVL